jgi:hypothetical protein
MLKETPNRINVKQAVAAALDFIKEVYVDEKLTHIGLEEVRSDGDTWRVTVGFSRPWDYPKSERSAFDVAASVLPRTEPAPLREYKTLRVDGTTGEVLEMEIREE